MSRFDVAILGGGFAGSILARCLVGEGAGVLLLEKSVHPRFALGESTTPLANFALERIAARYGFTDLHSLAAWGRWTQDLPHLRRGLKRGFSFYGHQVDTPWRAEPRNLRRALFAASPDEFVADTHWLRADVDQHLWLAAQEAGAEVHQGAEVVDLEIGRGIEITWAEAGLRKRASADRVVDATGEASVVSRRLRLEGPDPLPFRTHLVAAHVAGLFPPPVPFPAPFPDQPLEDAPYPEERAAVHHLLDGGWLYVLPFDGEPASQRVSSVGLVLRTDRVAPDLATLFRSDPAAGFHRALAGYPSLTGSFRNVIPVESWRHREGLAFRRTQAAGDRWVLLPGAFAFFDPLFSTGIAWSLLGVERARDVVCGGVDPERYGRLLAREADQMARLTESAYLTLDGRGDGAFDDFVAVALCYFGAVSWAESLGRLKGGADAAWSGFLGAGDEVLEGVFRDVLQRLRSEAPRQDGELRRGVSAQLAPRDVAGLDRPSTPNVYPVDLEVLVQRADRLGLERSEVRARLDRLRGQYGRSSA